MAGTFTQLRRVAVDASGDIWGADLWGNRVEEFTPSYAGGVEKYTYAETIPNPVVPPGDTSTSIYNQVRGIAFDSSGDAVTMDTVNQRVVVFNSGGNLVGTCGQRGFTSTGDFNWPRGVAVDPVTGDYWIADTKQSDLQILEPLSDGCTGVAEFVKEGTAVGDLDYPYSIAIGGGYAWVADTKNNRIESWNVATCTADKGTCSATSAYSLGTGVDTGRDRRRPDHRQRLRRPERQELLRRGRAERQRGHRAPASSRPTPGSPTPTGWPPTEPTSPSPRASTPAAWWCSTNPAAARRRPSPASDVTGGGPTIPLRPRRTSPSGPTATSTSPTPTTTGSWSTRSPDR